jgi:hypothetical protein
MINHLMYHYSMNLTSWIAGEAQVLTWLLECAGELLLKAKTKSSSSVSPEMFLSLKSTFAKGERQTNDISFTILAPCL